MIESVVTTVCGFLNRGPITARKLVIVLVLALAGGVGVVVYEIETSNFAMAKYAKAAAVLKDLEASSASTNEGIAAAANLIVERVGELLEETGADPGLSESGHRIALAMTVGLPWLVFAVTGVVEAVRREPDWQYGLFGCLALAVLLGGVAYSIPTQVHWFYRYVVFPFVVYSGLLGLFFAAGDEDRATEA